MLGWPEHPDRLVRLELYVYEVTELLSNIFALSHWPLLGRLVQASSHSADRGSLKTLG